MLTILGDASGLLYIQPNQTFFIEYTSAVNRRSVPPVNFHVSQDATVYLPADFRLIGDGSPSFYLDGTMVGVYNLTIGDGRRMEIGQHATNRHVSNGTFVSSTKEGMK